MAKIQQRKRIFFGCEGQSELAYALWLQEIANQQKLNIHVVAEIAGNGGGDPLAIVQRSIQEMRRIESHRGAFKHKCILLDSDKINLSPERDRQMYAESGNAKINLIFQKWEHEAFLLRHFPGLHTHFPPAGQGEARLLIQWRNYKKPMSSGEIMKNLSFDNLKSACSTEAELCSFLRSIGFSVP